MASRAKRFLRTEERKLVFLRILANWKASHGASKSYKWPELISEFKKQTGETVDKGALQNKLANMRTEYSHWKNLLKSEPGLCVDPSTGILRVDSLWWVRKLKESRDHRKFISSGVPKVVEDLCSQILDGSMATGNRPGPNANVQPIGVSLPEDRLSSHVFGSATQSKKQKRYDSRHEEDVDDISDMSVTSPLTIPTVEETVAELYRMKGDGILEGGMEFMGFALNFLTNGMHRKLFMSFLEMRTGLLYSAMRKK